MKEQGAGQSPTGHTGPTIRVRMGASPARHTNEIHIDGEALLDDATLARRAQVRRCQEDHLEAAAAGTCIALDCPFAAGECSEVTTYWLLAHRDDEDFVRELADDPTLGRDPQKVTSFVRYELDWMRVAEAIPALRSVAFSHLRGFSLVAQRAQVYRMVMETGTPEVYAGLLRMLYVTGLEVPRELRGGLREHLVRDGIPLGPWEDLLGE